MIPLIFRFPSSLISRKKFKSKCENCHESGQQQSSTPVSYCLADDITADIKKYIKNIIPLISSEEIDKHQALIKSVRIVAF